VALKRRQHRRITSNAVAMIATAFGVFGSHHCEPTGRANARPMTGFAKQSMIPLGKRGLLRRFAPRNDDGANSHPHVRGILRGANRAHLFPHNGCGDQPMQRKTVRC
jgi:hypothetical protein